MEASPRQLDSRLVSALGAIGVAALSTLCAFRPLRDFDLPWNLASGRLLWMTRTIPNRDDLAYTHAPLKYIELVADWLLFASYRIGGEWALQIFGAAAVSAVLLLILWWLRGAGPVRWLALGIVAASVVPWCQVRPATVSFPLLVWTLGALHRHRTCPTEMRWLGWLVPTQLLWANIHGFAALSAALIASYAAYRMIAQVASGRLGFWLPRRDGVHWQRTVAFATLAIAATCVNSAGPALLLGPFRFNEPLSNITEWATPTFKYFWRDEPIASFALVLALVAFAFGREPSGERCPPLFNVSVMILAAAGAMSAVRLLPLAVLAAVPIAALRQLHSIRASLTVGVACAATPSIAAAWMGLTIPLTTHAGFDANWLPEHACRYIERAAPSGRVYNFMPFGGYLAWRLHPKYRVFMDGRNELARDATLVLRSSAASTSAPEFESLVAEFDMQWALTRSTDGERFDTPLAASQRWTMTYLDDIAAVYVRIDGPNRILAESGYQLFRHLIEPAEVLNAALLRPDLAQRLLHDGQLAALQAPRSARAAFLEACSGLAVRDMAVFRRGLERLIELSPAHPAVPALLQAAANLPP